MGKARASWAICLALELCACGEAGGPSATSSDAGSHHSIAVDASAPDSALPLIDAAPPDAATPACHPGEQACIDDDRFRRCAPDGTWNEPESCGRHGSCLESTGQCLTICRPGQRSCEGRELEVCNPKGTGWDLDRICDACCREGECADVVPETCNAIDDNCDGRVDEDTTTACYSGPAATAGVGACRPGTRPCRMADAPCSGEVLPAAETCNGVDDDCDGRTDEDTDTPCFDGPAGTEGVGQCRAGVRHCVNGAPGACEGEVGPADETCNGLDDDCDGHVDDGFDLRHDPDHCGRCDVACLVAGARTFCDDGTCAVADCLPGSSDCNHDLAAGAAGDGCETAGPCQGDDDCDGVDDDGDGHVDEGYVGQAACGLGECRARSTPARCVDGVEEPCRPGAAAADDSVCDGLDEDCDGSVDEDVAPLAGCGVGRCAVEPPPACVGGVPQACEPGAPASEVCNGQDDDCDGTTDEGFDLGASCTVGLGACARDGERVCADDGVAGCSVAAAEPQAATDTVCDGVDEDCDGSVDEDVAVTRQCGVGECAARSTPSSCEAGTPVDCRPGAPAAETCNGLDDDCDGTTDEDYAPSGCGTGACAASAVPSQCVDGHERACRPGPPLADDDTTCDGVDDDCDGGTDEEALGPFRLLATYNPGATRVIDGDIAVSGDRWGIVFRNDAGRWFASRQAHAPGDAFSAPAAFGASPQTVAIAAGASGFVLAGATSDNHIVVAPVDATGPGDPTVGAVVQFATGVSIDVAGALNSTAIAWRTETNPSRILYQELDAHLARTLPDDLHAGPENAQPDEVSPVLAWNGALFGAAWCEQPGTVKVRLLTPGLAEAPANPITVSANGATFPAIAGTATGFAVAYKANHHAWLAIVDADPPRVRTTVDVGAVDTGDRTLDVAVRGAEVVVARVAAQTIEVDHFSDAGERLDPTVELGGATSARIAAGADDFLVLGYTIGSGSATVFEVGATCPTARPAPPERLEFTLYDNVVVLGDDAGVAFEGDPRCADLTVQLLPRAVGVGDIVVGGAGGGFVCEVQSIEWVAAPPAAGPRRIAGGIGHWLIHGIERGIDYVFPDLQVDHTFNVALDHGFAREGGIDVDEVATLTVHRGAANLDGQVRFVIDRRDGVTRRIALTFDGTSAAELDVSVDVEHDIGDARHEGSQPILGDQVLGDLQLGPVPVVILGGIDLTWALSASASVGATLSGQVRKVLHAGLVWTPDQGWQYERSAQPVPVPPPSWDIDAAVDFTAEFGVAPFLDFRVAGFLGPSLQPRLKLVGTATVDVPEGRRLDADLQACLELALALRARFFGIPAEGERDLVAGSLCTILRSWTLIECSEGACCDLPRLAYSAAGTVCGDAGSRFACSVDGGCGASLRSQQRVVTCSGDDWDCTGPAQWQPEVPVRQCAADQRCDAASGQCRPDPSCVDPCVGVACPSCRRCSGGACVADVAQNGAGCGGGNVCQAGQCAPPPDPCAGVVCATCNACNPATGACAAVADATPCPGGACAAGRCQPAPNCDADGDGHRSRACGGDDCDDGNSAVYPGHTEVWDTRDNNCDGAVDDVGLTRFSRYFKVWTPTDYEHRFGTSAPAGFEVDPHWVLLYPTDVCENATYRPRDLCQKSNGGQRITFANGNELLALAECGGTLGGKHITLYLAEGSGEYNDYISNGRLACRRFAYAFDGRTSPALPGSRQLWRHRSPFDATGVSDNMWSTEPMEANPQYNVHEPEWWGRDGG
jgi:hypothetical protein